MDSFAQVAGSEVAVVRQPDAFRDGLETLSCPLDNSSTNVEHIQKNHARNAHALKEQLYRVAYGAHFVDGLRAERAALSRVRRGGVLPSSMVALESSLGSLHNIGYEDYMNLPHHRTEMQNIHQVMEKRFADDY